ncbi:MAG: class I SAM-dependent methyltransferase [Candidatus Bathyarchaeota archaeon]|nr:class I SAM-dependent methyltransferase [Candidatus Bathyarchaeota archaeon]
MGMSEREEVMAKILGRPERGERFLAVTDCIRLDASAILDLGCGTGVLASTLAERVPSALVVGVDKSRYLLSESRRRKKFLTVLSDIPCLPFKNNFFDAAVAIQVLHEIFHFKGADSFLRTLKRVHDVLREEGYFIILDHVNPGGTLITLRLPKGFTNKLCEFQCKFKARRVKYEDLDRCRIRISMRDFYDFVTKIWALNSELEEEEMNETHTPFTSQEIECLLQQAGFKTARVASLTSIDSHLEHCNIILESSVRLPNRHILIQARKDNSHSHFKQRSIRQVKKMLKDREPLGGLPVHTRGHP